MYKYSKYNLLVENEEKDLLIANLLTGNYIKIPVEKRKKIKGISLADDELDFDELKILIKDGFAVKEEIDEMQIADENYNNFINSNKLLHLTIIPTDACNFKCIYCYEEERENINMSDEIKQSIIKYIKDNINNYKQLRIDWFGGEPLLMKDLIVDFMSQVEQICREEKIPLFSGMSTNGYNLDLETFQKLYNHKVTHFQISIDGIESIHNKYRPHKVYSNSFEIIFKNVKDILQNMKGMYRIILRVNLTRDTLENIYEFIELISIFRNNKHLIINWQFVGDYGGEQIHKIDDKMLDDYAVCADLVERCNSMGINTYTNIHISANESICEVPRKNSFTIDYLGRVTKCSLASYDKNNKKNNVIGQLENNGKIKFYPERLERWSNRLALKDECYECLYYPLCMNVICPYKRQFMNQMPCHPSRVILPKILINIEKQKIIPSL